MAPKTRAFWNSVRNSCSRSLILATIESAYATSYQSLIVTLVLSCFVSEILQVFCCTTHLPVVIPDTCDTWWWYVQWFRFRVWHTHTHTHMYRGAKRPNHAFDYVGVSNQTAEDGRISHTRNLQQTPSCPCCHICNRVCVWSSKPYPMSRVVSLAQRLRRTTSKQGYCVNEPLNGR